MRLVSLLVSSREARPWPEAQRRPAASACLYCANTLYRQSLQMRSCRLCAESHKKSFSDASQRFCLRARHKTDCYGHLRHSQLAEVTRHTLCAAPGGPTTGMPCQRQCRPPGALWCPRYLQEPPAAAVELRLEVVARQREQRGAVLHRQLLPVGQQRLRAHPRGVQRAHLAAAPCVEAAAAHVACRTGNNKI